MTSANATLLNGPSSRRASSPRLWNGLTVLYGLTYQLTSGLTHAVQQFDNPGSELPRFLTGCVGPRDKLQEVCVFVKLVRGHKGASGDAVNDHDSPAELLHVPISFRVCRVKCHKLDVSWLLEMQHTVTLLDLFAGWIPQYHA